MMTCSSDQTPDPVVEAGCGCGKTRSFDGASPSYRRALTGVIGLNIVGFVVVAIGSWLAGSASLAANTLDFAADAATYAISLWVIGRSVRVRSAAALFKGASLAAVAISVVGLACWRAFHGSPPQAATISGLGVFGVAINLIAALLLVRFRDGDANVRSVWLCTRNDLVQCVAVVVTGIAVGVTRSRWPDLIVGVLLAAIFFRSAWQIVAQARAERRASVPSRDDVTRSRQSVTQL